MRKTIWIQLQAIAVTFVVLGLPLAHAQPDRFAQTEQLVSPPPGGNALLEARTAFNTHLTYAQPQGGALVTFKSPREGEPEFAIKGVLFRPDGEARGAVVIINSDDGWSDVREGHYARAISSGGYAVLAIDSYTPRGVHSTAIDNAAISTYEQARDAFAGKRYLVSLGYPADRVAVMGVGRGGTIALLAADRTFMHGEKEQPFAVAMAVSAICFLHPRLPKPSAKLFIAIGDKDDETGIKPCQDLAREYSAAGGMSTVKVYPGAPSRFDGDPVFRQMYHLKQNEVFASCIVAVEPDGRLVYGAKSFAATDSGSLFAAMRKSCGSVGATAYTNVTQKARVTLDLIDFLDANLSP